MTIDQMMQRSLAAMDGSLVPFRLMFVRLNSDERHAFKSWVEKLCEHVGAGLDDWLKMVRSMGAFDKGIVGLRITLEEPDDGPRFEIYPPVLLAALQSWEAGEAFTPDQEVDLIQ